MRLITDGPGSSYSRFILALVVVHLAIGIFVHVSWLANENTPLLRAYFDYEGALVFMTFAALQLALAIKVYRGFAAHQHMKTAWFYVVLSSASALIGTLCRHILAVDTAMNPIPRLFPGRPLSLLSTLGNIGTVLGGTVQMIMFGAALYLALRTYREFGLLTRLNKRDIALIGASVGYALLVIIGVARAVWSHPAAVTVERALTWPGDYLLSLLLLEAIFLRRATIDMGWSYVSRVWGAFATGVFLTSFCSLMNWLTAYGLLSWVHTSFVWYLWYPAAAAFALAPAYEWEAMQTARYRLEHRIEGMQPSSV